MSSPLIETESNISPPSTYRTGPTYESAVDTPLLLEVIPTTVSMLVNTILILINVYHNKRHEHQLIGMSLGTVFSNIIGYLLISSLNIGLACQIAKAREKKRPRIIGIYYQRALVVDFIACILIITPLLYVSNKLLAWNDLSDNKVLEAISKYLFQLVPSIYAFTFFDTTRVYLQSQYVRVPPMLILLVSLFFHYFISDLLVGSNDMESMGAAWAKNFTDICCAVAIYLYIVRSGVVNSSWIEWNMQCLTNWKRHLKLFVIIGFTSYLEALMFLLFIVLGSSLSDHDLAAHISLANWSQLFFLIYLGLKQGLLTQLYELIEKNMWKEAKSRAYYGIKLTLGLALLIDLMLILYKKEASQFFLSVDLEQSSASFNSCFVIYLAANVIGAVQLVISAILKAIDNTHPVLRTATVCYLLGLILGSYLAHVKGMFLRGLWVGWIVGLLLNLLMGVIYLRSMMKKWDKIHLEVTTLTESPT